VVTDLFREHARYSYRGGWNPLAVAAFVVGAVPAIVAALVPALKFWSPFSWFIGAALSGLVYAAIAGSSVRAATAEVAGMGEGHVR
jgi:NCS1 family nucleobase:cation symporter-1